MLQDQHSDVYLILIGTLFFTTLVVIIVKFLFQIQKKNKSHTQEKERFQQELLRTQLEIREQTLKNISQEIHDNIGQTLSLARLHLATVDYEKQEAVKGKVDGSKELVSKAIHDLRHLSKSLNTDSVLAAGLVKAVEAELTMVSNAGVFQTGLTVTGQPQRIDPKKELILFRIVQEAVNNVIKHSKASAVAVTVAFADATMSLTVQDNGQGFATGTESEGSGLRNMASRAALIGARFEVRSNAQGTSVLVTVSIAD